MQRMRLALRSGHPTVLYLHLDIPLSFHSGSLGLRFAVDTHSRTQMFYSCDAVVSGLSLPSSWGVTRRRASGSQPSDANLSATYH